MVAGPQDAIHALEALRSALNDFIGKVEVAFFRSTLLGDDNALAPLVGKNSPNVHWMTP